MPHIHIHDHARTRDNIRIGVHDVSQFEQWDELGTAEKLEQLKAAEPDRSTTSHNTTCIGLDELRAETLAETYGVEKATAFALGDNDTAPDHKNRSINNKVGEVDISEYTASGNQLVLDGFAGSDQLNGETLTEIGTISDAGRLLNHAVFNAVVKDSGEAVHFEVVLSFTTQ